MALRAPALSDPLPLPAHRRAGDGPLDGLPTFDDFDAEDRLRIDRARAWGIAIPITAMRVARWSDVPFYILCAYLMQESSGGSNIWGNDPTWMRRVDLQTVGLSGVTKEAFLVYRCQREKLGNQGVGGLQLTHWSIQDRADELGGCWDPLANTATGAEFIAVLKRTMDWWHVAERYNGSAAYADHNAELRAAAKVAILGD